MTSELWRAVFAVGFLGLIDSRYAFVAMIAIANAHLDLKEALHGFLARH